MEVNEDKCGESIYVKLRHLLSLYKRLQELGIPTTIVRNTDETLNREERINRILNAYGNNKNTILVSNHMNAGGRYKVNMISL